MRRRRLHAYRKNTIDLHKGQDVASWGWPRNARQRESTHGTVIAGQVQAAAEVQVLAGEHDDGGSAESRLRGSVERDGAAEPRQVGSRGDRLRAARTDIEDDL
jgi:hypothetical protein